MPERRVVGRSSWTKGSGNKLHSDVIPGADFAVQPSYVVRSSRQSSTTARVAWRLMEIRLCLTLIPSQLTATIASTVNGVLHGAPNIRRIELAARADVCSLVASLYFDGGPDADGTFPDKCFTRAFT